MPSTFCPTTSETTECMDRNNRMPEAKHEQTHMSPTQSKRATGHHFTVHFAIVHFSVITMLFSTAMRRDEPGERVGARILASKSLCARCYVQESEPIDLKKITQNTKSMHPERKAKGQEFNPRGRSPRAKDPLHQHSTSIESSQGKGRQVSPRSM